MAEASNHPKDESMGKCPFELSSELWLDVDDVRAAGCAEKGHKRVEPGAVFRIVHGLILECVDVESDGEGNLSRVTARVSDKKPKTTIHGVSRDVANPVEIWEPEVIESEEDDPASRLVVRHGYAEPAALSTEGTWHAVRYGYCVLDRNERSCVILSAKLRSSA